MRPIYYLDAMKHAIILILSLLAINCHAQRLSTACDSIMFPMELSSGDTAWLCPELTITQPRRADTLTLRPYYSDGKVMMLVHIIDPTRPVYIDEHDQATFTLSNGLTSTFSHYANSNNKGQYALWLTEDKNNGLTPLCVFTITSVTLNASREKYTYLINSTVSKQLNQSLSCMHAYHFKHK
jgi:hypothetical protein